MNELPIGLPPQHRQLNLASTRTKPSEPNNYQFPVARSADTSRMGQSIPTRIFMAKIFDFLSPTLAFTGAVAMLVGAATNRGDLVVASAGVVFVASLINVFSK